MRLFLDTSSLVKAYVDETGSQRVLDALAAATAVVLSVLAEPEMISAMNRLRREKKMTDAQYRRLKQQLMDDLSTFEVVDLNRDVLDTAIGLLESNSLRASDALHIASAYHADVELFLTSDNAQHAAARVCGIKVLNPIDDV